MTILDIQFHHTQMFVLTIALSMKLGSWGTSPIEHNHYFHQGLIYQYSTAVVTPKIFKPDDQHLHHALVHVVSLISQTQRPLLAHPLGAHISPPEAAHAGDPAARQAAACGGQRPCCSAPGLGPSAQPSGAAAPAAASRGCCSPDHIQSSKCIDNIHCREGHWAKAQIHTHAY